MNNKYIKKSVEIEAIQWNGNNLEEIIKYFNDNPKVIEKFLFHSLQNRRKSNSSPNT